MIHRLVVLAWCLSIATPVPIAASQRAAHAPIAATERILGRWRIVRSVVAPWVMQAKIVDTHRDWIGRTVAFEPRRVVGPGIIDCANANYRPTSAMAEGLFQGSLLAPANDARVVQRLLEHHFVGSMAFDSAHMAYHAPWLSSRLRTRISRYFARQSDPNEVPAIDGDPFTDSQEHPTRFSVSLGTVRGDAATLPVRFSDGRRVRTVQYLLRRDGGAWRVDDMRYESRETLGQWLR